MITTCGLTNHLLSRIIHQHTHQKLSCRVAYIMPLSCQSPPDVQIYFKCYQFWPMQYDAALAWTTWRSSAVMVLTNQDNKQRSTSDLVNTMNRILILANVVSPPTTNKTITDHVKHAYPGHQPTTPSKWYRCLHIPHLQSPI